MNFTIRKSGPVWRVEHVSGDVWTLTCDELRELAAAALVALDEWEAWQELTLDASRRSDLNPDEAVPFELAEMRNRCRVVSLDGDARRRLDAAHDELERRHVDEGDV